MHSSTDTQSARRLPPQWYVDEVAEQEIQDGRANPRFPLFQPVTLHRGVQLLSAFSRDVSETGMGLLHDMPIGGEYKISIEDTDGCCFEMSGIVLWCRPCGQGWYISGVRFCRNEKL